MNNIVQKCQQKKTDFTDTKNLPMIMSLSVYKSGLLPHYSLRHLYVSSINNITIVFCELYSPSVPALYSCIHRSRKFKSTDAVRVLREKDYETKNNA